MKSSPWLLASIYCLVMAIPVFAQYYPPGYRSGVAFRFGIGGVSVKGFIGRSGVYPPGLYPRIAPYGVVQRRVIVNVVPPPTPIILEPEPEPDPEYDTTGVDLDLVKPTRKFERKIPGKDVSVPKKPIRPGEARIQPKPKKVLQRFPGRKPEFRRPKPALKNPQAELEKQLFLGRTAFQAKEYGLATQRFRRAIQLDPTHSKAYFYLSQAYFALGRYQLAVKTIETGMKRDALWTERKYRPRLDLYQGIDSEFSAHLKVLQTALKANPKSAILLFLTGHQLWFDNRQKESLPLFQRARPLSPDPSFIDRFLKGAGANIVAAK